MIVQFKQLKFLVKWTHYYRSKKRGDRFMQIPYGTKCTIWDQDEQGTRTTVATGDALVHPTDRFCKAVGRKISLTRALEAHGHFPKPIRQKFWEEFSKKPEIQEDSSFRTTSLKMACELDGLIRGIETTTNLVNALAQLRYILQKTQSLVGYIIHGES